MCSCEPVNEVPYAVAQALNHRPGSTDHSGSSFAATTAAVPGAAATASAVSKAGTKDATEEVSSKPGETATGESDCTTFAQKSGDLLRIRV